MSHCLPQIAANGFVTAENKDGPPPDTDQVRRCETWLNENAHMRTNTFNTQVTSYGWKHAIEFDKSYVSNGALLQAAVNVGIPVRQVKRNHPAKGMLPTVNGYLPLSNKIMDQLSIRRNISHEPSVTDWRERVHVYENKPSRVILKRMRMA